MTNKPEQTRLKRSLDEDELIVLKRKIYSDDPLVKILRKLVKDGRKNIQTPPPHEDNWTVKRAYADGQHRELDWIETLLNWSD